MAALGHYLFGSPYYTLLSTLPPPDQTNPNATTTFEAQMAVHVVSLQILNEMTALTEAVEEELVEREVQKRKTRLDAAGKSKEELRNEIGVEIWQASQVSTRQKAEAGGTLSFSF